MRIGIRMNLSVAIPCYNECGTIEKIVAAVRQAPYTEKEIIIVDDCSTDGSTEILRETWFENLP